MARWIGPLQLLLCTVIWGAAFLAQKLGADHYGPFAITCYRNILGGVFLYGCIRLRDARRPSAEGRGAWPVLGGAISGFFLFCAMMSQQVGIERTTPGMSAFLTANYVLFVPLLAWLVGRGRPNAVVWIAVALALVGTSFLCFPGFPFKVVGFRLGVGEAWTLLCAVLFAVQIMAVDRFARHADVLRFSCVQLLAAALFALPFVFLPSELARVNAAGLVRGIPALVFLGVFSSGIAYTLQNLGQARTAPALAALIMSLESVFGALFGWLLLKDVMTPGQLFGCLLLFVAVVVSQRRS